MGYSARCEAVKPFFLVQTEIRLSKGISAIVEVSDVGDHCTILPASYD